MNLSFTGHALERMGERGITPVMVRCAVEFGDSWDERRRGRACKVYQTATMRVVLDHAKEPPVLVTAAWREGA